jgi:hypothetical protein
MAVAALFLSIVSLVVSIVAYRRPAVAIQPVPMLTTLDPFCTPLGDDAWSRWDASCRIGR